MRLATWKNGFWTLALLVMAVLLTAGLCDQPTTSAQDAALQKANSNKVYIPKNNIELDNYNSRQKIADDPSTILWCTSAFPIPSSPLFTIPVLGKLTSSTKRPFSTATVNTTSANSYSPELPGPDGMYGASDAYRYGFTPGGIYVEWSGSMETYCTTQPTVWQRQSTTIVLVPDDKLVLAQQRCQALVVSKAADAAAQCQALLQQAVGK